MFYCIFCKTATEKIKSNIYKIGKIIEVINNNNYYRISLSVGHALSTSTIEVQSKRARTKSGKQMSGNVLREFFLDVATAQD